MKRLARWTCLWALATALFGAACGSSQPTSQSGDETQSLAEACRTPGLRLHDTMSSPAAWAAYLGDLDPVWHAVPTSFYDSPFLGNGGLGAAVYQTGDAKRLSFKLGDTRVRDHQPTGETLFGNGRLPIGELVMNTAGDVSNVDLRLALWNAQLSGTVTTTQGAIDIEAFVDAQRDVLAVKTRLVSGSEQVTWSFTPAIARSPRLDFKPAPPGLLTNPAPILDANAHGGTCIQNLAAGGQTVTAWRVTREEHAQTLYATVAHIAPSSAGPRLGDNAGEVAERTLAGAERRGMRELFEEHQSFWHAFYPKSFVSVADTRLESFYWIQLYKMASATRKDKPVLSTIGPWLEKTPWPGTWWDLNVQLEYWLIHPTGHDELDSLTESLDRHRDSLVANVPAADQKDSMGMGRTSQEDLRTATLLAPGDAGDPEVGDLTWALHDVWLAYRHHMDDRMLRHLLFPLLRKSISFYLHYLEKDASGIYHLPKTYSPEYASSRDCNYDLALLHWGISTLLYADARLDLDDPMAPTWRDVLEHLTPPPQDAATGFWIGADVQLTSSHRHYSHLLWFYPLYQFDVTRDAEARSALEASLAHWLGTTGAQQGYTFTGSGSMYAALGEGDKAYGQLVTLLNKYVQRNTMYKESGPVIETPLSGAQTMHDMLVQSWGGASSVIRIFPAVPAAWSNVTVHDFRAEGGFLVSAVRRDGVTRFIRIKSVAGEPCRIQPGNLPGPYDVRSLEDGQPVKWQANTDGTLELALERGDDVVIVPRGTSPDLTIAPAGINTIRYWGLP